VEELTPDRKKLDKEKENTQNIPQLLVTRLVKDTEDREGELLALWN
jgi:hypothetical protein